MVARPHYRKDLVAKNFGKVMRITGCLSSGLAAWLLVSLSSGIADTRHGHAQHGGGTKIITSPSCEISVHLTEEAERQPGGALYKGKPVMHHMKPANPVPAMKGAHMDHRPRHRGAFFMAPDKTHHLEGIFSDQCGFQLVFYNAFTKPIRADRFRAFIKVIPRSVHEPEVIRFLSPNEAGTLLAATIGDAVTRPFDIELYVRFPQSEDPELFTIPVPALVQ